MVAMIAQYGAAKAGGKSSPCKAMQTEQSANYWTLMDEYYA